jgi:hypothetical protein
MAKRLEKGHENGALKHQRVAAFPWPTLSTVPHTSIESGRVNIAAQSR